MGLDIYGCKSVRKSKARHEDDFYQIEDKNIDFLSPLLDRIEEKEFEYHNTLRTVKHICKSHKPTHHQNLQKSLPFQPKKEKIKNFLPFKKI